MININSDSYMTQGQMKCHPPNLILVGRSNNLANLFREQTNNKSKANQKNHQPLLNFVTGSPHIIICQAENTIYHCINFSFSLLAQLMEQLRSLVLFPVQIIENWIESSKVSTWEYIGSDHLSLNRIKGREIPRKSAKCKFEMFF